MRQGQTRRANPAAAGGAMRRSQIEIGAVAGGIGAEIGNVDVSQDLDQATIGDIRRALLDRCVIFFRDRIERAAPGGPYRRFGEIFLHPNSRQEDSEILQITRAPGDARIIGEEWHADATMTPEPPMGAILYAMEVPLRGDTLFANQYLAYEALSVGVKDMLAGVRALHLDRKVAGPDANRNAQRSTKVREDGDWRETISAHPVVVTHPETGRKPLYVNRSYTFGLEGMTEEESAPLLHFLLEHGHRPEFTCRFRWKKGSIAFWDNRSCKHLAVHDAGGFRRVMRRSQIKGGPLA
jgi:taurine dioxygenase